MPTSQTATGMPLLSTLTARFWDARARQDDSADGRHDEDGIIALETVALGP